MDHLVYDALAGLFLLSPREETREKHNLKNKSILELKSESVFLQKLYFVREEGILNLICCEIPHHGAKNQLVTFFQVNDMFAIEM